ncbi:inositol monophosphatase family protein [Streptomyces sp. 130]|uniref:inositol monophosphatase family protein n=1 Tax=Streptomyces sp. 130 TaxID=2591006 RepID=UPI00117FDC0F|nr:inositol monophosphatase family protein [Streptomyces sp. 130]TRV74301.1 inositol monophosphatase family protein [Streptomyces sp. 130]
MVTMDMESDAEVALRAASAGAAVVREMYGASLARYEKDGGDFATAADIAAEEAVLDVLRAARPGDAVTGEESGSSGAAGAGRRWLVDPLCGTLNYAVGNMLVAVNVALRDASSGIVAAASADPFSGEVFWTGGAVEGAWVRRADGRDERLIPSAGSRLVDLNLDPPFPHAPGFRAVELMAAPEFVAGFRPRVVSSTVAVAWVAAGRRAAYVTDGGPGLRLDSVHFAAGIALCEAAGCVVTGIDGLPVDQGAGGLVVAADRETHGALLGLVRR